MPKPVSQPGGDNLLTLSTMPTQARRVPSGVFLVGQNPVNRLDVDHDGQVIPLDVLRLISRINAGGSPLMPVEPGVAPQFFDVTGDNILSALDDLHVINFINFATRTQATGETPATFDTAPPELSTVEPLNTAAATVGPNQNANQRLTSNDASHVATALPELMVLKEPTRSSTVTPPRGSSPWMDADAEWESLLDVLAQDAAAAWG